MWEPQNQKDGLIIAEDVRREGGRRGERQRDRGRTEGDKETQREF